ncbi:hypothetical protein VaNZ11_002944 [Volvox africanus]|uniref:Uncharacterized protein n=1 Tax=Volvox africanus TaxID=51714 RepID=A0ABQ5RUS8_9CHLO|nr:hypothetical protein VaNZ11_002944 [Volvox africanus]
MGVCLSRTSEESELAKQVLGTTKADAKTVRRLSALGIQEGEVWITRQTSDIRKVFKFGAQINKGQFGTIHVVTNSAGDKFACKQISKRKLTGPNAIRDVRREIEIMHHLRGHPNVITFHGAYEDANEVYMVMELCTGGDLFERIEKITTITERAAASLFRDLVETVSYCHTLGVVHRDLKPENFLITDRGPNSRIKLADFGLSCFYQEGQEEMHDVVGSAYYMAPEVIQRQYGGACDTWSLGVILHILLCGAPPFTGSTDADILRAVRTQEVDLTVSPWPSVSRHARHLVSKMLEKDQDKRIRLDQVMSHPWLRPDGTAPPRALQGSLRDRISQFRTLNMFKREARRVLAAALPPEEVSGLKLLFENLDTDHDGMLSLDELRDGLARGCRGELLEDADVKELLKAADLNCDGFLDYREFVAATYSLSRMQRNQVLLKAFRHFDLDGDGYITREELSAVLSAVPLSSPIFGGPGSPGTVRVTDSVTQLVAEADLDADGRVNYQEFCTMVLTAGGVGDGGLLEVPELRDHGGVGRSNRQLVQPASLPGLVDEAKPRGSGGGSIKRRDQPAAASDAGVGGAAADGSTTLGRRALSNNSRGALSNNSRGGGGGSARGGSPVAAVAAASSSSRPSQPSLALAAVPQTASGHLQGRLSGSVHSLGKATGAGWSAMPSSAHAAILGGPITGEYSNGDGDGSGSEDSVLMMTAARQQPLQLYGESSVRNGGPPTGLVIIPGL